MTDLEDQRLTEVGMIAILISEGFFADGVSNASVIGELKRRGRAVHPANVSRDLGRLAEQGFLTKEENGYRTVEGMTVNIVEA